MMSGSIASKEVCTQYVKTWSHIVPLRGSVLCSHLIPRSCRAILRSRRMNYAGGIGPFRTLIDTTLWQALIRTEKLEYARFASVYTCRSTVAHSMQSCPHRYLGHRWLFRYAHLPLRYAQPPSPEESPELSPRKLSGHNLSFSSYKTNFTVGDTRSYH